jgi:hypothetical protein
LENYPPYSNLVKCFEQCPQAIFTYVVIWKSTNQSTLIIPKDDVKCDYLTDLETFLQELSQLKESKLIEFVDDGVCFLVKIPSESYREGKPLC